MVTKIHKWGNSLGIRIPGVMARELNLSDGVSIEIIQNGDTIVITQRHDNGKLSNKLRKIRSSNLHEEIATGDRSGNEAW
ncbi:MAG: AbrB/MazE/SpoVT family DNA-binding domain-containing protein [Spirochaetes bacterium]|nr:MAG: AbrB/MazE/SpoVT family DNA-binding domain-containing protein [Spirochaetota bacterium]